MLKLSTAWLLAAALTLGALHAARADALEDARQSLVLLSVTRGEGYSQRQVHTVEEMLLTELSSSGFFKVMGRSDIEALLSLEQRKRIAGCTSTSCLEEIGGALGADLLATADVGRIGSKTIISLKVLRVHTASVAARAEVVLSSDDDLPNATHRLVQQLAVGMGLAPPATLHDSTTPVSATITPSPAPAHPPTVAVLYFDYDGSNPELTGLRKGLAQMLITDLSSESGVQIVERTKLQQILKELQLDQTGLIDPASASKVGKLLGARFLVMGGYFEMMGSLRVDARLVEVETGRVVKSVGSHCTPDKFLDLEQQLAAGLKEGLAERVPGAHGLPEPAGFPGQIQTITVAQYGKALDDLDHGNRSEARHELRAVLKQAPGFTLAAADLSRI